MARDFNPQHEWDEKNGSIRIANEVVGVIAGLAAMEVKGVYGMSGGMVDGITELLKKKNLSKGVRVEVGEKEAAIDLSIIVEYGSKIPEVAVGVQENVKRAIESMTGLTVVEVNVHIQGVEFRQEEQPPEEKRVK
ncbi:MAG TPA: Asp23/Gls24 family envelope stress response protein [Firmicutes bacterium]|nr:Asp23/Gls24 family envelope stress response protein [Bacillota bacterium]